MRRLPLVKAFRAIFAATCLSSAWAQDFQRNATVIPEGYYNARHATDGQAPLPAAAAGELRSYSTEQSIGIEWDISGDTDHDATCSIAFRAKGAQVWRVGFPLMRVDYEGWYDQRKARRAFNMVAGSLMFLAPGTEYEVRLELVDPDGGRADKTLAIATRPEPDLGKPLRVLHVRPGNGAGDGSEAKPFASIADADKAAKPGDLFLLHAGRYGACELTTSGDATSYVAWKSADDGAVVLDQLKLNGTSRVWIEGVHLTRAAGTEGDGPAGLRVTGASPGCVVKRCVFRGYHHSMVLAAQSHGWHISDNDIAGDKPKGINGEGIELNHTRDHTVCHNHIRDVADGVSYPDGNCDIFANDIHDVSDDGIEPDYGYANIRVWHNRLATQMGFTFQPMYCGPWYFVRNQVVVTQSVFKLRVQDRFICVNNTFAGWSNRSLVQHAHGLLTSYSRNNLWVHLGGSESLWVASAPPAAKYRDYSRKYVLYETFKADWRTDLDYDGFDWSAATPHPKLKRRIPFLWNNQRAFTIEELAQTAGIEKHGRTIDKARTFAGFDIPATPTIYRKPLVLAAGGDAIDAGVVVPNLSETFTGKAPDLGAFEYSQPVPQVGPR